MTSQQSPYLRVQRNFPSDNTQALTVEIDRSYVDIAQKVNSRTIGLFALGSQIVTGERWSLSGPSSAQQTLRQVYTFQSAGNFPHNINFSTLVYFTRIYGAFYDGTNWYPLPYVNTSSAGSQVSILLNATDVVITAGGSAPSIQKGVVVLEWLSNV